MTIPTSDPEPADERARARAPPPHQKPATARAFHKDMYFVRKFGKVW